MKFKAYLIVLLFAASASLSLRAQSSPDYLVKNWERAKAYTKAYLDAMPDSGYALKPVADIRSFAGQMLHLADGNYLLGSLVIASKNPFQQGELEKSTDQSKANVTKIVLAAYDFIIDGVKKMTPAQLSAKYTLFDKFEMTHEQALEKVFEHQTHHRGQTAIYLRLAGVKPPPEMLF